MRQDSAMHVVFWFGFSSATAANAIKYINNVLIYSNAKATRIEQW